MNYVITWTDANEQLYYVSGEKNGTPFKEDADEYSKIEAEKLISENSWYRCEIEEV